MMYVLFPCYSLRKNKLTKNFQQQATFIDPTAFGTTIDPGSPCGVFKCPIKCLYCLLHDLSSSVYTWQFTTLMKGLTYQGG